MLINYKEVIESQLKLVNYYLSEGEKNEKELKISIAMKNYVSAIEPLLYIQEREDELRNVIPELYNKVKLITSNLKNKIINLSSKVEIRALNQNIKTIVRKRSEEPIKVKVIYKMNGKEIPLKDFSLKFEIIKGNGGDR